MPSEQKALRCTGVEGVEKEVIRVAMRVLLVPGLWNPMPL
jgi:hypothetical protein